MSITPRAVHWFFWRVLKSYRINWYVFVSLCWEMTWFRAITPRNASDNGFYEGPFYIYDPEKDHLIKLKLENFPPDTDRVWHGKHRLIFCHWSKGFDILETSPANVLIYAINRRRTGSMIERFHYTVGSTSLVYDKSFDCHNEMIFTPNDVAVVGEDAFYVSNVQRSDDHSID